MAKSDNLTDFLTDVANAIREKKGTSGKINPQDFSKTIREIESGAATDNPVASADDVNFRDYEGTVRYSYSKEDFLELNELPPFPTHRGLVCQEWNWQLDEAKEYVRKYGILEVGATYTTDTGKTRLYIIIDSDGLLSPSIYYNLTGSAGEISWGDGVTETLGLNSSYTQKTHTYSKKGSYVIELSVKEGSMLTLGSGSTIGVIGSTPYQYNQPDVISAYCAILKKIELGSNVALNSGALAGLWCLESVNIPKTTTFIGSNCFKMSMALKWLVIPRGITQLTNLTQMNYGLRGLTLPNTITTATSLVDSCFGVSSVVLPSSIESFGTRFFANSKSITKFVVPESVKTLGSYAFSYLSNVEIIDFTHCTSIPQIADDYTFYNLGSKCKIYVPFALYNDWILAPRWTSLQSKIYADYTPTECVSLTIAAHDVQGYETTAEIEWSAITNGVNINGERVENVVMSGVSRSNDFTINDTGESREIEVSFTYLGVTKTATITQYATPDTFYAILLNNQWRMSDTIANPDSAIYDGVYESFSNYNVSSGVATMYIKIKGYSTFKMYIRSYGESNYDYMMVSQPDVTITGSTSISDTSKVAANTYSKANSGTAIDNYTLVEFTNLSEELHTITVLYRKDSSGNNGTDRGYVLIPINQ